MGDIVLLPQKARKEYIFRNHPVPVHNNDGDRMMFPCIGLYHQDTGIGVAYPGYERWYLKLIESEHQADATLYKKANALRQFLNFILWNTNCDSIHELTLTEIRDFIADFRYTEDDEPRDPSEWNRGIAVVYDFLNSYYVNNCDTLPFKYNPVDLITTERIKREGSRRSTILKSYNKFSVKPLKKDSKRNRTIPYDYLELLLDECKRHDPMIAFGVACQAYAGLREGEVVNLTRQSIHIAYSGFGKIRDIELDLTHTAAFAESYEGTSSFGSIKKPRKQLVFTDFVPDFFNLYNAHESLMTHREAVFTNRWGQPLSVTSYTRRLRDVFNNHFLPDLKRACVEDGWAKNAPYIESFENQYPGAHALRHWFTMYLLEHAHLKLYEVSKWRGDDDPTSMQDYVHINAHMIDIYNTSLLRFQKSILESFYE